MPPPPVYFDTVFKMPAEQLRDLQNSRFLTAMTHAWKNPFYQRHWGNVGLESGDIKSLDDLPKIPPYTVNDLRDSYERQPPFGEHMGVAVGDCPLVMQTSGGTTGLPRPTLHTPRDREISDILVARRAYSHGIRPGDPFFLSST
jgi:phenylacetate-CoA ligase